MKISILRRLNVLIILYLDDILSIARSHKEIIVTRDTLVFLLQNLRFLKNFKKPVLQPCQKVEFLGVILDSKEMTLSLPEEKILAIMEQFHLFLTKNQVSGRERERERERERSTNEETVLFGNCSSPSSPSLQVPPITTDLRIFNTQELRRKKSFVTGS